MTRYGYHASHEQFAPSALLRYVAEAESAGFASAMCSDHFHPWTTAQGQSGYAWSWLGAALQATSLTLGTVCAPGQRYHPAVVAQAAATVAEMFPDRLWLAVGSGQNLNEHITGDRWLAKPERNARLLESVEVMRSLWRGDTVSTRGEYVTVDEATLYTLPERPPLLVGAAITPVTAEWVGGWADALITIAQPLPVLTEVVDAFRRGGGEGKPMLLQSQHAYAPTYDEALTAAHEQWGANILASPVLTDLRTPADFEEAAAFIRPDDADGPITVSADLGAHAERLREFASLGFDEILLHGVHRDQSTFIRDVGEQVLPELTR